MSLIEVLLKSKRTVFNTIDLAFYWSQSNTKSVNNLAKYFCKTNKLIRIHRGVYSLVKNPNNFEVAQVLTAPSYISLMTALNYHGINFQFSSEVHVMSKTSKVFKKPFTIISHKLKEEILLLNDGLIHESNYTIASKERAICDTLYFYPDFTFDNLNDINWNQVEKISKIYNNLRLIKTIKNLKSYAK